MRKLILTSFTWSNGQNQFTEQRLVVIDSQPFNSVDEDREIAAKVFIDNFNRNYRECELMAVVPHETIQPLADPDPGNHPENRGETTNTNAI
jgi:hypothetical protein